MKDKFSEEGTIRHYSVRVNRIAKTEEEDIDIMMDPAIYIDRVYNQLVKKLRKEETKSDLLFSPVSLVSNLLKRAISFESMMPPEMKKKALQVLNKNYTRYLTSKSKEFSNLKRLS